ncbi:hypothetical protein LINPERHAP2_LOCUS26656, partial [Linum perenne]
ISIILKFSQYKFLQLFWSTEQLQNSSSATKKMLILSAVTPSNSIIRFTQVPRFLLSLQLIVQTNYGNNSKINLSLGRKSESGSRNSDEDKYPHYLCSADNGCNSRFLHRGRRTRTSCCWCGYTERSDVVQPELHRMSRRRRQHHQAERITLYGRPKKKWSRN